MYKYFTYTIQLSLLDEMHKLRIIIDSDVAAFLNHSETMEKYYPLNPGLFAVKSSLYFFKYEPLLGIAAQFIKHIKKRVSIRCGSTLIIFKEV